MKDIYVKFTKKTNSKDIPGESLDADHKDWLEVTSWSHDIVQPKSATASSAGGHTAERCEHGLMTFTKDIDKASVYLWEASSAAYAYDVEIQFFRATGSVRTNYLTIKLTNAIIAKSEMNVPATGLPVETFSLKYAKITWLHKGSKTDGSANVGNDVGGWDLASNKAAA
ncbi:Hcp family type VI secretion system effector [Sphaerotilaceae bacterium SBD11-9]